MKKKKMLSPEEQYLIYSHYLGKITIPHSGHSPLRSDPNPSFAIYATAYGNLRWKDFAASSGDVYSFIMSMEDIDFREALDVCDEILKGRGKAPTIKIPQKKLSTPVVEVHAFTDYERDYWAQRGVHDPYQVYGLESLSWGGWKTGVKSTPERPRFVYDLSGDLSSWKIYNPLATKEEQDKWKSYNTRAVPYERYITGKYDTGIIFSSLKDAEVGLTLVDDIEAIAPIAEGNFSGIINELDKSLKGIKWYAFLDFDFRLPEDHPTVMRGVERTKQMCEASGGVITPILLTRYQTNYFMNRGVKDIDEAVVKIGTNGTKIIKSIIRERTGKKRLTPR